MDAATDRGNAFCRLSPREITDLSLTFGLPPEHLLESVPTGDDATVAGAVAADACGLSTFGLTLSALGLHEPLRSRVLSAIEAIERLVAMICGAVDVDPDTHGGAPNSAQCALEALKRRTPTSGRDLLLAQQP